MEQSGFHYRNLFSAYAEVFPASPGTHWFAWTFLCLRRGVSGSPTVTGTGTAFSLPTQRCFPFSLHEGRRSVLFSAYAEVFLDDNLPGETGVSFSLPTQRCFPQVLHPVELLSLFSAYAEVFPRPGSFLPPA